MTCETFRNLLPLLTYEEISFEEENEMEAHALECAECRTARVKFGAWQKAMDGARAEVPAGLLARCRSDFRAQLNEIRGNEPKLRWYQRLLSWRMPPAWLRPAGAFALVAVGFFGGRVVPSGFLTQVAQTRSEGLPVSRVRYISPDADGRLQIVVDETRQREFSGDIADERVQRLLMSALQDPADPGLRAESIEILKAQAQDETVRRALLHSLKSDTNSAVRLKALEGLRAFATEDETRAVLCDVLLGDDHPAIRAQAVDLLILHKEPELAGVFQELLRYEENSYVRARTIKALSDMKASAGTF